MCSAYSFFDLVRALWTPGWLAIVVHRQNPEVLEYYSTTEMGILVGALLASILLTTCITLRQREIEVRLVTIVAPFLSMLQLLLTVTPLALFVERTKPEFSHFSTGICACIISIVTCGVGFVLFVIDAALLCSDMRLQSDQHRRLTFSIYVVMWYVLIGAVIFTYLEPWMFETSGQFCVMTLLTIGYGNIVPHTLAGRGFMVVYTTVGLGIFGFYIVTFSETIAENAERKVQLEAEAKQHNNHSSTTSIREKRWTATHFFPNSSAVAASCSTVNASAYDVSGVNATDTDRFASMDIPPPPLPLVMSSTINSVVSVASQSSKTTQERKDAYIKSMWRTLRLVVFVFAWWAGSAAVFWATERRTYTYIDMLYFCFVTMTGIGYGDVIVEYAWSIEFWYFFILNAVAIVTYSVGLIGDQISARFARIHTRAMARRERREKRRREKRMMRSNHNVSSGYPHHHHHVVLNAASVESPTEMVHRPALADHLDSPADA